MNDARQHRLCLLLALAGTLMLCALMVTRIHETFRVLDLPTFEASKPPVLDPPPPKLRGPRV